jgi:serine/threonine-protein kinase
MLLAPNLVVAERFRLNKVIGRGGMGSVWLATHLGLDIPCAVKFIEGHYALQPEAQTRFEREAKAAAALRSPHVVQILDHGVWQGVPYLAMELLEGEDLGHRLKRVGRLHPKDACVIVAQVARALTKAHAAGIVHRDLKPDNIFLVRDDDREFAKVLDFGIAKVTGGVEGSSTKTGAMLGTPYYMSPEQAQGIKAVDYRSDLWSMGVIVFQAVTGNLPFESTAIGDLIMRIIVQPIPVPSAVHPGLPHAFDRWWAKASSRDPARRFQSAKQLSDDLLLAFGQSQLTDVMDRHELRAVMGSDARVAQAAPSPFFTPNPAGTPPPAGTMPVAQQPMPPVPYAMEMSPYPMQPPPPQAYPSGPHGMTGAPMAHTFGQTPGPPKSRVGLYAGIGVASVLLMGALAVAGTMASRGRAREAAPPSVAAPIAPAVEPTSSVAGVTLAPRSAPPVETSVPSAAPAASSAATTAASTPKPFAAAPAARPFAPVAPKKQPGEVDLGI